MRRWIVMAAVLLGLTACSNSQMNLASINPEHLGRFPLGTTEKADVICANGHPQEVVTLDNHHEGWIYVIKNPAGDGDTAQYTVEFGPGGQVVDVLCRLPDDQTLSARALARK